MKKVVIIGGGLAGLISAVLLSRKGISCTLIEKKTYPFHKVCGEYISNETVPFLQSQNLFPAQFQPPAINQFQLSSVNGKSIQLPLDLGGFGISRFIFDNFLYEQAKNSGTETLLEEEVERVNFRNNQFEIKTAKQELHANVIIGAFGKRSRLDINLDRSFIRKRSPFVGVKYHIKTDHPDNLITLHNFNGGYCGISNIENGKSNLCYLSIRDHVKKFKSIREMEENVLFQNPLLKSVFKNSDFLFDKPETINEISFETKGPVFNHILMVGDSAGMITPLCGNGMAMAIHSAKIASDLIIPYFQKNLSRGWLEKTYATSWRKNFAKRLWIGRLIQNKLFGREWSSNFAVNLAVHSKSVANLIIKNTHGVVF